MACQKVLKYLKIFFLLETFLNSCKSFEISGIEYLGHHKESYGTQDDYRHYYVSSNGASWTNANNDCQNLFGKDSGLVSLGTEDEKNSLNRLLEDYGYGAIYWTSGVYDPTSSVWRWEASNEPVGAWAPWANGTPPANPNALLKIGISYQNRFAADWVARWNTELQRYICEVQYPSTTPMTTELTTRGTTHVSTVPTTMKSTISDKPTTQDYITTTGTTGSLEIISGEVYQIISAITPRAALHVHRSNLTNDNRVDAYYENRSCSDLSQVWRLDNYGSDYVFKSGLGDGSDQWLHIMKMCDPFSTSFEICIWLGLGSAPYWKLNQVLGTRYWTIRNTRSYYAIKYTGVPNGYGIDLRATTFNDQDPAQWWEFVRC